jgi:hypothetical protein
MQTRQMKISQTRYHPCSLSSPERSLKVRARNSPSLSHLSMLTAPAQLAPNVKRHEQTPR